MSSEDIQRRGERESKPLCEDAQNSELSRESGDGLHYTACFIVCHDVGLQRACYVELGQRIINTHQQ